MLVLSRKVGETIMVDKNISIQILKVTGGSVRLGIEAPSDIRILRGELVLPESDDLFSGLAARKAEPLEGSLPETDAGSQIERPGSRSRIPGPESIDAQQLLRQTDLLG